MRIVKNLWFCVALLPGMLSAEGSRVEQPLSPPIALARRTPTTEAGIASFYHDKYHGRPTASGEVFDTRKLSAAHRTLPFGTLVKVTRAGSDQSVIVRINDRGPFIAGRVIDLSRAAARELQMERAGLINVTVEVLSAPTRKLRP